MDATLKLLADASLDVGAAEEAVEISAWTTAQERLDAAATVLAELREKWPTMGPAERAVVGASARTVRERLDAAQRRVPRRTTLVEVPAEEDPEQDAEPEAA